MPYDDIVSAAAVDDIRGDIDAAIDTALANRTLRDLALASPPAGNDGAVSAQAATGLVSVVPAQPLGASADNPAGGGDGEATTATGQERS